MTECPVVPAAVSSHFVKEVLPLFGEVLRPNDETRRCHARNRLEQRARGMLKRPAAH